MSGLENEFTTAQRLKLHSDASALGVAKQAWTDALSKVEADPVVGIKHAALDGNEDYRLHVAEIPERVGNHFHQHGDEEYAIVSGAGRLHWGAVENTPAGLVVKWEAPVDVSEGDRFTVPEGYAHQLERTGETPLVIIFACPDAHLDDDKDRTMLADSPKLKM